MTDAEDRLRGWLEGRAAQAPRGQFMLDRVRQESARRTRRRRMTLAAGLAAAAVVAILGAATIAGRPTHVPLPAASSTSVAFVAGAPVRATFPLQITGYSTVATLVGGHPTLVLPSIAAPRALLTVTAGAAPPPADAKPVRLGTASAAMVWNGSQRNSGFTVWWTLPTGGWATISAPPEYPLNLIEKIISGLRPGSMSGAEPFTFATVPRGFTADNIDSTHVTFCPPDSPPDPSNTGKILVRLDQRPLDGAGEHVTVAGRPGLLTRTDATTVLRVAEARGQTLTVQVPATIHVTRADLFQFAAGIQPTNSPTST